MKPLSICMALAILLLSGAAFTPGPDVAKSSPSTPMGEATMRWMLAQPYFHSLDAVFAMPVKTAKTIARRDMSYYWFTYPGDAYIDYNTVAGEEWNLWLLLGGVIINTNPIGGTLLEKGYLDYGWPHGVPYEFLYGHFVL